MKKSSMNALMTMEIDFVEFHIQTMVQNDDLLPKKILSIALMKANRCMQQRYPN
jgi:hypothetical protein